MAYWRNQFFLSKINNASFTSSIFDLSGNIETISLTFNNTIYKYIDIYSINQQTNNFGGLAGLVFSGYGGIESTSNYYISTIAKTSNVDGNSSQFSDVLNTNIIRQILIYSNLLQLNNSILGGTIYSLTNYAGNILSFSDSYGFLQRNSSVYSNIDSLSSILSNQSILRLNSNGNIVSISDTMGYIDLTLLSNVNIQSLSTISNIYISKYININGQTYTISNLFGISNKIGIVSISPISNISNINNTVNYKIVSVSGAFSSETDAYIYIIPIIEITALPIFSSSNVYSENSFLRYSSYASDTYITLNTHETIYISNSVYIDGEISLWSISE